MLRLLAMSLALMCCISACGRQAADSQAAPDLSAILHAEFDRLGIDPQRVSLKAPSGDNNYVFDLSAVPADSNPLDSIPADSIRLAWTERMQGDYDANGIVNISDLTPLGQRLGQQLSYDDPAGHSGLAIWPTGDPEADPDGNWKKGRVDGDGNGLISTADITPIAQHWNEKLSGYRIYRRLAGQESWQLLANPDDASLPYSIGRGSANPAGVYRYSFTDSPSTAGTFDYRVVAYDAGGNGRSASEATLSSNIATASLDDDFSDTLPPVWDAAVGITDAVANPDGTVTVSWGSATDVAPAGVAPSPPVGYTVYWSRETPLDFGAAAKAESVESGWISPVLLSGTEYHFAVRASDSASPPNADGNTEELPVTTSGDPVEDTEPPVWIEPDGQVEGRYLEGIRSVEPMDGILRIEHATAIDSLSPPVHYDLYYIRDSEADSILIPSQNDKYIIHPDAIVIQDIPPVIDLELRNREAVWMLIRARDSAPAQNTDDNETTVMRAPGKYQRIILDPDIPGIADDYDKVWIDKAFDWKKLKAYFVYMANSDSNQSFEELWFLEVDLKTGDWQSHLLAESGGGKSVEDIIQIGVSWTGDVWVRGAYTGTGSFFKVRRANGIWEDWTPSELPLPWYNENFDHNGNPVTFVTPPSEVQEDRYKHIYRWWDEDSDTWIEEDAVDPGSIYCRTFTRPDGVLQLLVNGEDGGIFDETPRKARIAERSVDGTWTLVHAEVGSLGTSMVPTQVTWESEVAWSGGLSINGQKLNLVYSNGEYNYLERPLFNDNGITGRYWPAGGGNYHLLPNYAWIDNEYFKQSFNSKTYSMLYPRSGKIAAIFSHFSSHVIYSAESGDFSDLTVEPNLSTGEWQWVLMKPQSGDSIFGSS